MIWLVVGLISISVSMLVMGVAGLVANPEARLVRQRLRVSTGVTGSALQARERRRRRERRESLESLVEAFGEKVGRERGRTKGVRSMLLRAGYRRSNAGLIYMGSRLLVALAAAGGTMLLSTLLGASFPRQIVFTTLAAAVGWMLPFVFVLLKGRRRQEDLQRSLPDALDLMVVCVEAGLGLNQALVRVGEEMERVSSALSEEFTLVSLEIRAGTARSEALRHLGERTGLPDVRAFVTMLIQTDRFGTSIAGALRIHGDELRTKRRQRAEETAAKLTVKLLIPIVLFIFPALLMVILGPAAFHLGEFFQVMSGP